MICCVFLLFRNEHQSSKDGSGFRQILRANYVHQWCLPSLSQMDDRRIFFQLRWIMLQTFATETARYLPSSCDESIGMAVTIPQPAVLTGRWRIVLVLCNSSIVQQAIVQWCL